jgi:uncharacterized protein (PEP-CTERM system associated)
MIHLSKRLKSISKANLVYQSMMMAHLLRSTLVVALLSSYGVAQAQGVTPTPLPPIVPRIGEVPQKTPPRPLPKTDAGPFPVGEDIPGLLNTDLKPNAKFENPPAAATGVSVEGVPVAAAASAPTVPRSSLSIEPSITTRATGSDNARVAGARKKDIYFELLPSLTVRSTGLRHRLNAVLGASQVAYVKDSYPRRFDPLVNASLNSTLIEKFLFLDASAQVERRPPTPFGAQAASSDPADKVRTQIYRLSPYILWRPDGELEASLRSDNNWTRRSSQVGVVTVGASAAKVFSQNTQTRLTRDPRPLGVGLELGDQTLRYDNESAVLRLQNALVSLGYAVDPELTLYVVGGTERSSFAKSLGADATTETDSDVGARFRWAPLERSVVTGEIRRRFFGNSFNVQWSHRSPFLGLKLSAVKAPNTQPDSVNLSGDLITQFDAVFRSRGFNAAQRESLVRSALNQYGLPDKLNDPVNLYLSRAQLGTTFNAELSLLGRRTVTVLTLYQRKLEQLQRNNDVKLPLATAADVQQKGVQAVLVFRLTPVVSLEAGYRFDRAQSLNFGVQKLTKENLFSVGSNFALSPSTKLTFGVQNQSLNTDGSSSDSNSATVSMTHRF